MTLELVMNGCVVKSLGYRFKCYIGYCFSGLYCVCEASSPFSFFSLWHGGGGSPVDSLV